MSLTRKKNKNTWIIQLKEENTQSQLNLKEKLLQIYSSNFKNRIRKMMKIQMKKKMRYKNRKRGKSMKI